jgi:hypothetical protein
MFEDLASGRYPGGQIVVAFKGKLMPLTTEEKKQVENFIKEGKNISDIRRENFPKSTYGEIYSIAHERTDGSSLGIKKQITYRLKSLVATSSKIEKDAFAKEIQELVNALYKQHKDMAGKLSEIREVLE